MNKDGIRAHQTYPTRSSQPKAKVNIIQFYGKMLLIKTLHSLEFARLHRDACPGDGGNLVRDPEPTQIARVIRRRPMADVVGIAPHAHCDTSML